MTRRVGLCGEVKGLRPGAEAKASAKRAFSHMDQTRKQVI
eukprot:CAMPEP_0196650454 /NCGR_PEP_ID=MMETSP1085-20130531/16857_1 /TAXON_ID=41879 ORGANISM="Pycnococcus sp, Strain CCMP1998" /NCGR_SAMPLE_ID=MMETSP1085 /ASSEMBLY_ACC=CAM_ASM_000807 /LENGTH=39 /DNA_ID= /DNA_START= /DNA_END= /DNA_ORIENTATION=